MNPKHLVLSHEGIHVDGLSHLRTGGAKEFNMHHDVVEVVAGRPIAKGAPVHVSSPAPVELA
jgi:hypothetical protein